MIAQVLYVIDTLLVLQGLGALAEGISFFKFVSKSVAAAPEQNEALPRVSVIAPCKGADAGLEQNITALFEQDYPDFEILFAIADQSDPSRETIERCIAQNTSIPSRLIVAGTSPGRSQKINNLLAAVECARTLHPGEDRGVLVFFDSDARPSKNWLRALVAPLNEPGVGATTGYRWYLPSSEGHGGFWSALLSAWNGTVATTLGDHGRNFAWGGSTAIYLETFDGIGVARRWESAASDDYALTSAVQQASLKIRFVPGCLLVTREHASLRTLLEFTTRQVIITRVYRPQAWWVGMISYALFNLGFWGSVIWIVAGLCASWTGAPGTVRHSAPNMLQTLPVGMCVLVALEYLLGCAKGVTRFKGALAALPRYRSDLGRLWWAYCVAWPLASVLFLFNFLKSSLTRRITWRGVRYELRSATETIVVDGG